MGKSIFGIATVAPAALIFLGLGLHSKALLYVGILIFLFVLVTRFLERMTRG